jgi:hypothetical protein
MYNFQDQPGLLRTKEVGSVMPFQTFAFEVFNTVREMDLPVIRRVTGKAGTYETLNAKSKSGKALLSKRLMTLARWVAAMTVTNAVVDRAIGRDPWKWPESFIPFIGYLVGGMSGRGPEFAPQQYVSDFRKGVGSLLKYGSWKKLRKWAVKYHVIAGTQFNRVLDGIEAVSEEGRVEDVRGRELYTIDPDEYWKAIVAGPYRTEVGKEYIEKLEGKETKDKKKKKRLVIQ